jgi:ABC-type dipeptide/oligopeptide/nickel transport system ATPase component
LINIPSSFIDRKVAEGVFRELLGEKSLYRVLNIYGDSGSGKSFFKEHIKRKYLQKNQNLVTLEIDFENRLLHDPKHAIMHLAKELEDRYDFDFITLWKAYAILWQKRYENSPIMYASDLPYVHEIRKLLKVDKKGNTFIDIIKGLFQDSIYKELQELKKLDTQAIEERLYKFFATDLKNMTKSKKLKDCIFLIDNHNLLSERVYTTPCKKDSWIRELSTYTGKDAIFIIFSQEPIEWQKCNIAWRNQLKEYSMGSFSKKDALRYLRESGIKDEHLREAICNISGLKPFYLSLAKYAYFDYRAPLPTVKSDIIKSFVESQNSEIVSMLKVLSFARVFSVGLINSIAKEFKIYTDEHIIAKLLEYEFVKKIADNRYCIDDLFAKEIQSFIKEDDAKEYLSYIFSYYEDILNSLDREIIRNTPELIDEVIEEAWYYLKQINKDPLVHFEWLDYYIVRFYMYAAWEAFINRYHEIIPHLKESSDDVSKEKLVALYNNLAGLYESIGESKKAKEYYSKVINLNRPQLLSA